MYNHIKTRREVTVEETRFTSFPDHRFFPLTKPHSLGSKPETRRFSFKATSQQDGFEGESFTIFLRVAHHQLSSTILPRRESMKLPKREEKKVRRRISAEVS